MSGKKKPCVYRLVGPEEIFNKAPFMGLYTEVPPPHTEAKAENTKSVSVHSGGKFKIFYCPAKTQWIVGVDVASGEGWLYIESNAATPDKARGGWSYWDSARNKWVCDRNLTVVLVSGGNAPDVDVSQNLAKLKLGGKKKAQRKKGAAKPPLNPLKPVKSKAKADPNKLSIDDFKTVRIIGRGSFGEVRVAKKSTGGVFAIKRLKKRDMFKRNQINHIWGERRFLASADNPWVVQLFHAFQDKRNLYFVLEYCPGGDLLRLLIQKERFTERDTAFYLAELCCAVQSVHANGFIHRDIKPDNILISKTGHLKLTDFGLCKQMSEDADMPTWDDVQGTGAGERGSYGHRKVQSCVGTPDYVAPEVLKRKYGKECDWWSVGVILFECVLGFPPFMSKNLQETAAKIMSWKKHLKFPRRIPVSANCKALILGLLTDAHKRLTFPEIAAHAFFKENDIDWKNLLTTTPPFPPVVESDVDTANFDQFDENSVRGNSVRSTTYNTAKMRLPDFTYNRRPTPEAKRVDAFSLFDEQENAENIPE